MDLEFAQRIAVLEALAREGKEDREELKESVSRLETHVSDIGDVLGTMREELAKYRGFWGGALLVVSAVWTFLQFAWEPIANKIKGE